MPSIPTDQTIYKQSSQSGLAGFKYSSSLLYGMEIIIYLDESVTTGSLQQNIKTLIQNNIPEIIDCSDCIKFESLDLLSSEGVKSTSISDKIALLEQERRDAELELQNWRFTQSHFLWPHKRTWIKGNMPGKSLSLRSKFFS